MEPTMFAIVPFRPAEDSHSRLHYIQQAERIQALLTEDETTLNGHPIFDSQIFDDIDQAVACLKETTGRRRVLVLISDAWFTDSANTIAMQYKHQIEVCHVIGTTPVGSPLIFPSRRLSLDVLPSFLGASVRKHGR